MPEKFVQQRGPEGRCSDALPVTSGRDSAILNPPISRGAFRPAYIMRQLADFKERGQDGRGGCPIFQGTYPMTTPGKPASGLRTSNQKFGRRFVEADSRPR